MNHTNRLHKIVVIAVEVAVVVVAVVVVVVAAVVEVVTVVAAEAAIAVAVTVPAFSSFPPSAAYMRHWIGSALVQIMACRLFGAKPLSKPMLGYCHLDP